MGCLWHQLRKWRNMSRTALDPFELYIRVPIESSLLVEKDGKDTRKDGI